MFEFNVGFTGTQVGMTSAQKDTLGRLAWGISEFHHGDCIGADAEAHELMQIIDARIHIHPPINETKRAFCTGYHTIYAPKDYLERNRDIVRACAILIATPKEFKEQLRSGTWATIRYARTLGRKHIIIFPNGKYKARG